MIAGAAKAGTTALHLALSEHRQVFVPERKEPDFFAAMPSSFNGPGDHIMQRRVIRHWDQYLDLFRACEPGQLCGEASVSYLYFHESAKRIAAVNPDAKVIIVLRNPVERAYSQYMFNRRDLRETLDFASALDSEAERAAAGWAWAWQYRKVGLYSKGVEAFLRAFGCRNVFVGLYDDLRSAPDEFMRQICAFLGINGRQATALRESNVSGEPRSRLLQRFMVADTTVKRLTKSIVPWRVRARIRDAIRVVNTKRVPMPAEARRELIGYYTEEVHNLETILGRRLDQWLK